jgi:formylglycine-generating enzyme required for sulfatase activity
MVEVTLSPCYIEVYEATNADVIDFLNSLGDGYVKEENGVWDGEGFPLYDSSLTGSPDIGLNDAGMYEWGESDHAGKCPGKTEDAAAGGLSWWGAKLMCEIKGKRLPTEAEWEAAARGQSKLIWPCAWQHLPCCYGKYDCCMDWGECYDENCSLCCIPYEEAEMAECDSLEGASGMYGNAAEWVLDGWDGTHEWCADGCTDPAPREGALHVLKGGSISIGNEWTRISARYTADNDSGLKHTGARCVRSPISFSEADASPDSGSDAGPDGGPDGGK